MEKLEDLPNVGPSLAFTAAVRFVEGGRARPWWHYTAERKRTYPNL